MIFKNSVLTFSCLLVSFNPENSEVRLGYLKEKKKIVKKKVILEFLRKKKYLLT